MADTYLRLSYGQQANLGSVAVENGTLRVTTDTQKAFVDINNVRVPLGDIVTSYTAAQITSITSANALPKIYMASDTLALYYFDASANSGAGEWKQVGATVAEATKAYQDGSGNVITTTYETKADALDKFNNITAQIADINSFEIQIIDDIANAPNPGQSNIIYFVANNAISSNPEVNYYDEWIFVTTQEAVPAVTDPETGAVITPAVAKQGRYEKIGTTETDLTNYYTKSETDGIESAIYTVLGITKGAEEDSNYVSIDSRIAALEGSSSTDGNRITELEGKFGAFNDTTATGFTTVENRFVAIEGNVSEVQAELGTLDSTATGYVTVADRLAATEAADAELAAQLGSLDSTAQGYVTVADRLDAEEAISARLDAELGTLDSTDSQYVTVADRLTALESADTSLSGRLDTEEAATTRLDAELGTLDSTATGYQTVAQRLTAEESATARLDAELGTLDSTDSQYVTVADRLTALETDTAGADAVAEINAKLGNMLGSTDTGFVSVEDRLTAEESATARLDAELGTLDSTATDYVPVATRISSAEADIDELEAQLGAYPASTDNDFVSVATRFTTDEADIAELQAQLGADYPASTAVGFKSVNTRLGELSSAIGNINKFDIRVVQALPASHEGESFVIYFVPVGASGDENGGHTKYVEYMWFKTGEKKTIDDPDNPGQTIQVDDGYFEEIGITEADLDEYYKASEIDAKLGDYSSTVISTKGTVLARLNEIEAKFGAYAASTDNGFATVEARFTAVEGDVSGLQTSVGTLEDAVGTYETDSTAAGYKGTISDRLDTAEGIIGAYESDTTASDYKGTVSDRLDAAEAAIGTYQTDSTASDYKGTIESRLSAIEGGGITQSEDQDDAQKPILVSAGNTHDEVEYVAGVTVNADDNSITGDIGNLETVNSTDVNTTNVTATTATAQEVVLGDATLTFDSNTGALVINF